MALSPNEFDLALMLVVVTVVELRFFGAFRQAVAMGVPRGARSYGYIYFIAYSWMFCVSVFTLWVLNSRPWAELLLGPIVPWRFEVGLGIATAYICLLTWQHRAIVRRPAVFERIRLQFGIIETVLPHTESERRLWPLVAVSAGICEEVIFRGFLIALMSSLSGPITAVLVVAILFGLGHAYQGRDAIFKTGAFGLILTFIALASGSLVPVMIIHFAQDLFAGDIGYRVIARPKGLE